MKYKMEICLLLIAITLFGFSAFFYSYNQLGLEVSSSVGLNYSYRVYALTLVGLGSVLMLTASVSFSRHIKNLRNKSYQI